MLLPNGGEIGGVGPDEAPAELLQAGGTPAAILFSDINRRVTLNYQWPFQWNGGHIVSLYKGKGDSRCTDEHRGLLLSDHSGKALVCLVTNSIEPEYSRNVPLDQYGAVSMRPRLCVAYCCYSSFYFI